MRGSYYFDCSVYVRDADPVPLSARRVEHRSAVFRTFDELLRPERVGLSAPRFPVLASVFLDSSRIEVGRTMVLTADIEISATDFCINGVGVPGAATSPNDSVNERKLLPIVKFVQYLPTSLAMRVNTRIVSPPQGKCLL